MDLQYLINNFEKYSFSGYNILQILQNAGHNVKIIEYNDLGKVNDLDEIFTDNDAVILSLVRELAPVRIGHWVVLLKKNNLYEYFDPYAYNVIQDLRIAIMDNPTYLPKLLNNKQQDGYQVNYNSIPLQALKLNVNTCGAHAICRVLFDKYTNQQYATMIKNYCAHKTITPDELVILMLSSYLLKLDD